MECLLMARKIYRSRGGQEGGRTKNRGINRFTMPYELEKLVNVRSRIVFLVSVEKSADFVLLSFLVLHILGDVLPLDLFSLSLTFLIGQRFRRSGSRRGGGRRLGVVRRIHNNTRR